MKSSEIKIKLYSTNLFYFEMKFRLLTLLVLVLLFVHFYCWNNEASVKEINSKMNVYLIFEFQEISNPSFTFNITVNAEETLTKLNILKDLFKFFHLKSIFRYSVIYKNRNENFLVKLIKSPLRSG